MKTQTNKAVVNVKIELGLDNVPVATHSQFFDFMFELGHGDQSGWTREGVARRARACGLAATCGGHHVALYATEPLIALGNRFAIVTGNFGDWL